MTAEERMSRAWLAVLTLGVVVLIGTLIFGGRVVWQMVSWMG